MKKFISTFIIVLFLASLMPLSIFADRSDDAASNSGPGKLMLRFSDDNVDKNDVDEKEETEMRMKLRKEVVEDSDFKERILKEEEKSRLRENSMKHQELFKVGKLKADEFRIRLETNKTKLKECREKDTEACRLIKKGSFEIAQNYLLNIIDALINHIKFVKEKVQGSEELSEQDVKESVSRIDALIGKLEDLKTKVSQATTRDQIIELNSQLRQLMKDVKADSDLSIEHIRHKRIGEILERAEHLEAKLARIQDRFGQNVTNNTELSNLIDQFSAKIGSAKDKYYDAVDVFESAKSANNSEQRRILVREAHELLKSAHQDLKDAHNVLKQIFRLLKGIDKKIDFNKDECWGDRPLFRPGKDLGYFIWQSTCNDRTWVIAWSGDGRLVNLGNMTSGNTTQSNGTNATSLHHMTGTITTDGEFKDVEAKKFESNDKINITANNKITFDAFVLNHFDEIRFKTTGTQVTFDLFVDGERKTSLVYMGKNWTNPSSIPFTLQGTVLLTATCTTGQFLVNGVCTTIPPSGGGGDDNDNKDKLD